MSSEKKKVGLDFLADLWSGRVANSIRKLWKTLRSQEERIQTIEEMVIDMTRQEQVIIDASQSLTRFGTNIKTAIDNMAQKLADNNVTVVDDELEMLQRSVAGIGEISDGLAEAHPTTGEPVDVAVDSNPPATTDPQTSEPVGEVPGNPTAPQPVPNEDAEPPVPESVPDINPVVPDHAPPVSDPDPLPEGDGGPTATENVIIGDGTGEALPEVSDSTSHVSEVANPFAPNETTPDNW